MTNACSMYAFSPIDRRITISTFKVIYVTFYSKFGSEQKDVPGKGHFL